MMSDIKQWYVSEDEQNYYDSLIQKQIGKINNKIKTFNLPFDYSIQLQQNMCFDSEEQYYEQLSDYTELVGVALFSQQWDAHILPVMINVPFLNTLRLIDGVSLNYLKEQISITLWHELAHGLIKLFQEYEIQIPFNYHNEIICEQFGRAKGNLNKSKLGKFILNLQIDDSI